MLHSEIMSGWVLIRAEGETTASEWLETYRQLKERLGQGWAHVIFDLSDHETVVPIDAVTVLCNEISPGALPRRWAFVVSRPVSVGTVNMIRRNLEAANIEVRVFETPSDAESWIGETAA